MNNIIEVKVFLRPHDNNIILAIVKGNEDIYYLRCVEGVWFCPCLDFHYRAGFPKYYKDHLEGKQQEKQYECKHIEAVESYLAEQGCVVNV